MHWIFIQGQEYALTNTFTIKDGLPSNHLYDLCEDNQGFLWISTDNGISRFDGTRFINYSIKDGLPSNDVLQVFKEIDGTIWVNCYKQPPSYFDVKLNRFISFENNKDVLEISNNFFEVIILKKGGIIFQNKDGIITFKNKKIVSVEKVFNKFLFETNTNIVNVNYNHEISSLDKIHNYTFRNQDNKILGKVNIKKATTILSKFCDYNEFYVVSENKINKFSDFNFDSFAYKKDSILLNEPIKWYKIDSKFLNLILKDGSIYCYDKKTFAFKHKISNGLENNCAYFDSNNYLWVSTAENGLMLYTSQKIQVIKSDLVSNNFKSVFATNDKILAGNFNGKVFENTKRINTIYDVNIDNYSNWIRNIFDFNGKTITIADVGCTISFKEKIRFYSPNNLTYSLKTAEKLNDSILLIGINNGILKFNVTTKKYKLINSPEERILEIVKKNENYFYFIANDGLFVYDLKNYTYKLICSNNKLENDKFSLVTLDEIGNIWLSTSKGCLIKYVENKIVYKFDNKNGLPENITKILCFQNRLWIASKTGIFVLNYKVLPKLSFHKIGIPEGLSSSNINSIFAFNNKIFAATENGISVIPSNIQFKKFESKPTLISVFVNNKLVPLSNVYDLKKEEKNITLNLASIDLTGHFNKFQYSINNFNWIDLEGNILSLVLKEGINEITIRALDVNNYISSHELKLKFEVAIPLYNRVWFWILLIFSVTALLFRFYNKQKFELQKRDFEKKLALEQQRLKITADLHDDIGSTLSSLQINSAVANKLMDKNPLEAQKVLSKIENQSQNLSQKIGDIIWSMKPGIDEFMTMSARIKNFANEILGSTNIQYTIKIDPKVDKEIQDISIRKNVVLITKEVLNNAVKYSEASKIEVTIFIKENKLNINILDNGIGFDLNETKGNGIVNIKNRISELKGHLEIISEKNKGTKIDVIIPLH